jgi:tetratricopeptide (TPR) repeat protein
MRSRWIWLTVLVLLGVLASGTLVWTARVTRSSQAAAHMAQARMAIDQGNWASAVYELRRAVKLDPKSDVAWLMLADSAFRAGHLPEALASVQRVPSQSANGAVARLLEGTLLVSAGQASRAEAALNESLSLDAASIDVRRRLVFLYGVQLRREELQRVLWELHDRGATQTTDLVLLSGSSFIVWNAREILPMIERFAATDPRHVPVRIALGYYRRKQNDLDGARRDLIEACRLAPQDRAARVALVECLIDRDEISEAARHMQDLPGAWWTDARLHYLQARLAERLGQPAQALDSYRAAVTTDPDHRESLYRLGQLLLEAGHGDAAKPHLDRAQKLADREILLGTLADRREPARYAVQVARLEHELGHDRLAVAWYRESVRLNPHDADLAAEAAEFAARQNMRSKPSSFRPKPEAPAQEAVNPRRQ